MYWENFGEVAPNNKEALWWNTNVYKVIENKKGTKKIECDGI